MTGKIDPAVEAYLANLPQPARTALEGLRAIIRAVAPDADEAISYGQPTFKQDGHLVAYAAFRKHLSFFPMSSTLIAQHADALKEFRTSIGAIQFTPEHPIPADLVRRMVETRLQHNREVMQGARRNSDRRA